MLQLEVKITISESVWVRSRSILSKNLSSGKTFSHNENITYSLLHNIYIYIYIYIGLSSDRETRQVEDQQCSL